MSALIDKVALITGGASGIGKATTELFIKNGAKVAIIDINETLGNELSQKHKGNAIYINADITSVEDHKHAVDETVKTFGKLDIAVNNAGIFGVSAPVDEYDIDTWKKVIDVNLNAVFYGMHYQLKAMLKNGYGSIINLASTVGVVAIPDSSAYTASKHGVVGLTKSAAWEYGNKNIRVNSIGPGAINTPLVTPDQIEHAISLQAIGRLAEPIEVAELIMWLASEKSSFVTGGFYPIDAGYTAQ